MFTNKITRLITLVLFVALYGACVETSVQRLGTPLNLTPVPPDEVIVYRTADQVPGKYIEVALLVSTGDTRFTTEEEMWKDMKKKAGKLGANAIILDAMSEPSAGAKVAAAVLGVSGADRKGKAIAIYILPNEKKKN